MEYIAYDSETTGLAAFQEHIVEVALVRFSEDGTEIGRYTTLVNPGIEIPEGVVKIHGITDEMVVDAPRMVQVIPKIMGFVGDQSKVTMVAHNAEFDRGFLREELKRNGFLDLGTRWECTMVQARQRWSRMVVKNHKLGTIAAHVGVEFPGDAHRALADALVCKGIWIAMRGPNP